MTLKLQNLSILKQKMLEEKEIIVAYNYFFDNFGENEMFLQLSKPARNSLLETVVGQTVGSLLGLTGTIMAKKLMMLRVPKSPFYHGACIIGGRMVNFIYFEDIQLGCIAVAEGRGNSNVQFIRFSTTTPLTQPGEPSPN